MNHIVTCEYNGEKPSKSTQAMRATLLDKYNENCESTGDEDSFVKKVSQLRG